MSIYILNKVPIGTPYVDLQQALLLNQNKCGFRLEDGRQGSTVSWTLQAALSIMATQYPTALWDIQLGYTLGGNVSLHK